MSSIIDARRFPAEPGAENLLVAPVGPDDRLQTVGPFAMVGLHRKSGLAPGALPVDADVRPHPHIGLVAITWMIEGHLTHRDSLGNRRELVPDSLILQVAGRGIAHSERYERLRLLGGDIALYQMLLALPDGEEEAEPAYLHVAPDEIPTEHPGGGTVRWLAHPTAGRAPVGFPTPLLLADVALESGAHWAVPVVPERAIFVRQGGLTVGGARVGPGQTALLGAEPVEVRATEPTRLLAFGGTNPGPRYSWWNYLHSSVERIDAAKAEWRAGIVKLPVGDTESFTPAPPDHGRPLRRLNAPR